jgi:predicted phosphoribosyltransferase
MTSSASRLGAIGWCYEDFTQVADQQVIAALAHFAPATVVNKPAA